MIYPHERLQGQLSGLTKLVIYDMVKSKQYCVSFSIILFCIWNRSSCLSYLFGNLFYIFRLQQGLLESAEFANLLESAWKLNLHFTCLAVLLGLQFYLFVANRVMWICLAWQAGWKLWPFAHLITYGVVPVEQRLLWVDCVELIWVTILST